MEISINYNGQNCIEYNQLKVNGREALGGFCFTFSLSGIHQGFENPITIFDIELEVASSNHQKLLVNSISSSAQLVKLSQYPNTSKQLHFSTTLSKEQLNALEEYRQEGDLEISLGLRALITQNSGPIQSFDRADFMVPREEWLTALKSAGFRKTILFEVPLPEGDSALDDLYNKAQEFIYLGHYKDAVMQCRLVIERIEKLREDKSLAIESNKKAFDKSKRQDMNAIERMMSLREQIKNVCQLGAHGSEVFTRSQAKAILGMTMAALSEPTIGFHLSQK